jgi:hypothetical protein
MKKSRFLYSHPEINVRKIERLEGLQSSYSKYLTLCIETLLTNHRFFVKLSEKKKFFPSSTELSSQIVKNVQDHSISIITGWAASKYSVKLKSYIKTKFRSGEIDEESRKQLSIVGKGLVDVPSEKVSQESIDLYWSWLLDTSIVGRTPTVSNHTGMRMTEMTSVLSVSSKTALTGWWLGCSHLQSGQRRIQIPLSSNPYIQNIKDVSKGILARRTKTGRWRFEVVEKKEWEVPEPKDNQPKVGVDVGLNVLAATSDGRLFGEALKPKFNALYDKIKTLRANRQRQDLKDNSPKLDCLESKLTGLVKTMTGFVSNLLISLYPQHTFIIEDLDLRGCRGQKRFAYKALHNSLAAKAACMAVNPAYTSQQCPSCLYVHSGNRNGTKFRCLSCGRISHADVVGAINLLGRSEDLQIKGEDNPSVVRRVLKERWRLRRNSPSKSSKSVEAPEPSGRRFTVDEFISIASNETGGLNVH